MSASALPIGYAEPLHVAPICIRDANELVRRFHRHHKPVIEALYAVGVAREDGIIIGAAIAGRPVARHNCDGYTAEIVRCVVQPGYPNACSMLYSAAWRAARAMGYARAITYILDSEDGTSLRAANWRLVGEAGGGTWHRPNCGRPRIDVHPLQRKLLFEVRA